MVEAQELAKLQDIHLPQAIGWWPLAPGWYLGILILSILVAIISNVARRFYLNGKPKREALQLLAGYEQTYQNEPNSQISSMNVSELLRRVALVYFPREEVAGLQGEAWLDFLTKTSRGLNFNQHSDYFLAFPYRPLKAIDLEPMFHNARLWIKQRRVLCSN